MRPPRHQFQRFPGIVPGHPIGLERPAPGAAMDDAQLPVPERPESDRLHRRVAEVRTVSRMHIHVKAPQAIRAVVALVGSRRRNGDSHAAVRADKSGPALVRYGGSASRAPGLWNGWSAHRFLAFFNCRENFAICFPHSWLR